MRVLCALWHGFGPKGEGLRLVEEQGRWGLKVPVQGMQLL